MPTRDVYFVPDTYYHVFNRGSEKRVIFQNSVDYNNFIQRIKDNLPKYQIELLCYCLMPNHFHFILKQTSEKSIANFMYVVQLGYAKFFNTKYERVGPLFQGRFKAKLIKNDEYLLQLSAYIHRNPMGKAVFKDSGNPPDSRNRIKKFLLGYPYSSYRHYINRVDGEIVKTKFILNYFSKTNPRLSYDYFVEMMKPDMEILAPIITPIE